MVKTESDPDGGGFLRRPEHGCPRSDGAGSPAWGWLPAPSSCPRGLFLEEHGGLSVADLEGADERRQLGGEGPPLRRRQPLEARDQACLADLGGLAEQGATGRCEGDGR